MRAGLEMGVKQEDWKNAAISASNLSELELTLGEVAGAVGDAEQSVTYADRSGDAFQRMATRTTHADALHQAGRRAEAEARFREAEQMQAERQPDYPLLYSLRGFRYCDLLLTEAERAAWQVSCSGGLRPPEDGDAHRATLQAVSERAAQTLKMGRAQQLRPPRHRPRPPHPGPRRALRGDSGGLVTRPLPRAPPARRGRPPPRRHAGLPSPRPPHPRLAALSHRRTHRPRERAGATWTKPGKSPSAAP